MRVEIKVEPDCRDPYAVLHIARLTPSLQTAVSFLEREGDEILFPPSGMEKPIFWIRIP